MKRRNIGILLFPNVELLDFAGPFEVFSVASELNNFQLCNVFSIGENLNPIDSINGLSVNPKYSIVDCPTIDILIIPGGVGVRALFQNIQLMEWIKRTHNTTEYSISICTGAMIFGKLGLLDNNGYPTHHLIFDEMKEKFPKANLIPSKRYVQSGKIFTSGGISAGIDISLHIIELIYGLDVAIETSKYMEYSFEKHLKQ